MGELQIQSDSGQMADGDRKKSVYGPYDIIQAEMN